MSAEVQALVASPYITARDAGDADPFDILVHLVSFQFHVKQGLMMRPSCSELTS